MDQKKTKDSNTATSTTVLQIPDEVLEKNDDDSESLKEIAIQSVDLNAASCSTKIETVVRSVVPMIIISKPESQTPILSQPLSSLSQITQHLSNVKSSTEPKSLFLLSLAKLNESSISLAQVNRILKLANSCDPLANSAVAKPPELSPPDSITNAPPSYSFVLRQTAAQRRPRLMGTFIPSPSFVQHTPPPNYAAAFDIYVGNQIPPPTTRVYSFGFTSMPVVCPECGYTGLTTVTTKITLCTHVCACVLCLFCCWVCAPLPYIMRSCKDVYHYCRNCRNFLGMYSPSNPETPYQL